MYRISCSEVWGGIRNEDLDACSAALTTSLYSNSSSGRKGGDIYYLSVCQGDMLTRVALADVVGHGEQVSSVSSWLYDILRERMNGGDGSEILADLNRQTNAHGFDAITTAAIVSIHTGGSQAGVAYAGHHPMLIRRRGMPHWEPARIDGLPVGLTNLPLGVEPGTRYVEQTIPAKSGDRLFLYTDGVIETPNADGELFGSERLTATLDARGSGSLHDLKMAVLAALRDFAGGDLGHDDVTLLAVELN